MQCLFFLLPQGTKAQTLKQRNSVPSVSQVLEVWLRKAGIPTAHFNDIVRSLLQVAYILRTGRKGLMAGEDRVLIKKMEKTFIKAKAEEE